MDFSGGSVSISYGQPERVFCFEKAELHDDGHVVNFENMPSVAPFSDTSASSASFSESMRSHELSDCSEDASVNMLDVETEILVRNKKPRSVSWGTVEYLHDDGHVVSFDNRPSVTPFSDTSASSASFPESMRSHKLSDCSEDASVNMLDVETEILVRNKKPRSVSWGTVEFRLYPILPGDHPDCSQGPPLTIAWTPVATMCRGLDDFEKKRSNNRKSGEDLRMNWLDRRRKLRRVGATEQDMRDAAERSHKIRKQRQQTASWWLQSRKLGRTWRRGFRSIERALQRKQVQA